MNANPLPAEAERSDRFIEAEEFGPLAAFGGVSMRRVRESIRWDRERRLSLALAHESKATRNGAAS